MQLFQSCPSSDCPLIFWNLILFPSRICLNNIITHLVTVWGGSAGRYNDNIWFIRFDYVHYIAARWLRLDGDMAKVLASSAQFPGGLYFILPDPKAEVLF